MPIIVNVDVMLAKRKMQSKELAEQLGITPANLSILKTGKAKGIRFDTLEAICKTCKSDTRICIAVDITGRNEWIKTKSVSEWQKTKPEIHKIPAIFLLYAGN